MAKYGTAALFLLASMMMQNAAADDGCAFPLVNSVYCPLHDVSVLLTATKNEAKEFGKKVDPSGGSTLDTLKKGFDYLYNGDNNPYNRFKTYPSYTTTKSDTMMCYDMYYGSLTKENKGYSPNDVVKVALERGVVDYKWGPALTQALDETVRTNQYYINEESAKKINQYTTALLEMYQLMEQAVQTIRGGCISYANKDSGGTSCQRAVEIWDEAAAVQDGPNYLGTKRCQNYLTCGWDYNNTDGSIAITNQKVLNLFQVGQNAVRTGDIVGVKGIIKLIQSAQLVSYIQGVGRYAQKIADFDPPCVMDFNKEYAEGMAFSTGMLPQLYQCDRSAALTVDKTFQLKAGNCFPDVVSTKDFTIEDFLGVLRKNYQCLGVTCEDVGGLWDGEKYYAGAGPCVTMYGDYVAGN
mmetsp:Transcript_10285/g.20682  ORF Transcript_10285/g.20682 Transcript_10285/m.20682 type:complete len:409 (+) Transcript_10285:181-1407(+)